MHRAHAVQGGGARMKRTTQKREWTYRGWTIMREPSGLGADIYMTRKPGFGVRHGVWSLRDAKRAIDDDIKQDTCAHERWQPTQGHVGATKPWEQCAECGKRRQAGDLNPNRVG